MSFDEESIEGVEVEGARTRTEATEGATDEKSFRKRLPNMVFLSCEPKAAHNELPTTR
jgi:hypothetical protein